MTDTSTDVSFYDGNLKLIYDLRPNQTLSFYGVGGHTRYELVNPHLNLTPNTIKSGTNDFMLGRGGWRWTVNPHLLVDTRVAYLQSPESLSNLYRQSLENDHHAEWVVGNGLVWSWQKDHVLEGGWMGRRVTNSRTATFYDPDDTVVGHEYNRGMGWKNDGYVQEASNFFGNRLHVVGGLRLDSAALFNVHAVSPQVSASIQVASATQLQFGVGRYNQFDFPASPPFLYKGCPASGEFLQTANHFSAGVEQRIGESGRLKITLFDRQNAHSLDSSGYNFVTKTCYSSRGFQSYDRDYSRGAQIVLQSRTANRLSGWIGYTLTYARHSYLYDRNPFYVPTLDDQRHTLNVFASYRISPSVHLSGKWLFGSGFPVPSNNNAIREGDYQRLDVRAEKDWAFTRWKLALYGEVLNLTNHNNRRYFYTSRNPDGTFSVVTGQGLPIVPTVGVAFEF